MKKFILLFITALAISSCSLNDEPDRDFVLLPVESVVMPTSYTVGNISRITVKYRRPTDCHIFNGFYYSIDQSTRTVAIQAVKLNNSNCLPDDDNLFEVPLDFKPLSTGTYTFKFWLGTDDNGIDLYETHEVEVL